MSVRSTAVRQVRWVAKALAAGLVAVVTVGTVPAATAAPLATQTDTAPSLTAVQATARRISGVLTMPASRTARSAAPDAVDVMFPRGDQVSASVATIAQVRRAAMIVIDTSGSMAGPGLAAAQAAARQFLRDVPADVEVGLEGFASAPRVLVAPTSDRARVRRALGGLRPGGGTALYDAVRSGLRQLDGLGSGTLLLLSDGSDTASRASQRSAEAAVRASGARAVAVAFRTGHAPDVALRELARAGQGAFTQALDTASLRAAFGAAARALDTQVRLTIPVPRGISGLQHLTLHVHAGGRVSSAEVDVELPAAPVSAAPAAAFPAAPPTQRAAPGHPLLWLGAGGVFAGLLALVLATAAPSLGATARRRLRELEAQAGSPVLRRDDERPRALEGLSGRLTRIADVYIGARASAERTAVLLERADLALQPNEWYVLRVLAIPVAVVAVWGLLDDASVLTMVLGAAVGAVVPVIALRFLASRRARRFELQLPDVLTLVASSLSTGFSLPQALDGVTRDAADPAAKEFSRALAETRIGVELEDALDRVAERMDSTNLAWTTMAVRIQRSVGGNLADVMRTTATTLRDRETLRRQVRALSAEGRLSAYILIALPILLAGYLYLTNRSYLQLLWLRPLGIAMVAGSGVLMVAGVFWMKRIVEVKV